MTQFPSCRMPQAVSQSAPDCRKPLRPLSSFNSTPGYAGQAGGSFGAHVIRRANRRRFPSQHPIAENHCARFLRSIRPPGMLDRPGGHSARTRHDLSLTLYYHGTLLLQGNGVNHNCRRLC